MTETGDDCYFYYYSTCARGDDCPFRHQPAARGCEITCNLWEKGRCFRKPCKFRHMVIEKDRATIPCVWESQPSGCMKPYCPFLHTKPKNTPVSQASLAPQSIPTLGTPGFPGNPGRGGPGVRPPVYSNNPPRPRMPPTHPQYMGGPRPIQQRPMGYQGFIPHSRPSHPMMYQMHPNSQSHVAALPYPGMMIPNVMVSHPRADYIMPPRNSRDDYDDSDDDYTSSDYSEVSISDDERRSKSRESSRRKVQSPRGVSSRREVKDRSGRDKKGESRSSRESWNDRKSSRRRHDSDKDRKKKDPERSRTKPRKESENKDTGSPERKKSESSDEKSKSETEEKKADIKIKTLEEILREKALKNLHERTAQKKKAQMEANKAKQHDSCDSPEPILKSVISVSKAESTSSQKVSEPRDSDSEVEFVRETKARSPKTIILDIIDPGDESPAKTVRQIKVSEDDKIPESKDNEEQETDVNNSKPSGPDLANIRVKTFEEIMEEKRQRKAQESKESVEDNKGDSSETQRTVGDSKPSRKIRVVKKDENIKETKTTSKVLVKKKVLTKPKTGGEVEIKQLEEEEEEKKEETKEEKTISIKARPKNIVIKSFDEIMREKRQRKQETTPAIQSTAQETTTTLVTTTTATVKRPTIIRNKQLSTNHPKPFKARKLKVIGRYGVSSTSKTNESVSGPASPTSSKMPEPGSLSAGNASQSSPCSPKDVSTQHVQDCEEHVISPAGGNSDDDDSWEHEELPAVPAETPTLEGPARVPGIPNDDSSILVIPGQVVQPGSHISPTKRPRSNLEELFGVPCEETNSNPSKESLSDNEGKDVSPAKKVKSSHAAYNDIVQAVNKEMSQKDDFDLDLEDEIANLPDKIFDDGNETLNEDDLLLELEEMINN